MDMQGWVTLTNTTGTTFADARTLLVAGDPNGGGGGFGRLNGAMDSDGTESGDRERLGDYYLYPLPARTTIANAQQKQVSFQIGRAAWWGRECQSGEFSAGGETLQTKKYRIKKY